MDKNRRAVRGCQTHAAENLRLGTKGFPVEEIPPASDCLPDEYTERHHIEHGREGNVTDAAENESDQNTCNNPTVDRETTLPDCKNLCRMSEIVLRLKKYEVEPGTEDRQWNHPDHHVIDIIRADAEFRRASGTVENPQNKTQGDDHTVEINLPTENRKGCGRVEGQVTEEGEADDRFTLNCLKQKHPSFLLCR